MVFVLVIVVSVLVQVQNITVEQVPAYVLATVMFVLAVVQHITVQQVILFVQILPPLVAVQVAGPHIIVNHVRHPPVFVKQAEDAPTTAVSL